MRIRAWSIVIPLVAAAAGMAGVYAYHQLVGAPAATAATVSTGQTAGEPLTAGARDKSSNGIFAVHESPRVLPEVPFIDADGKALTLTAFEGKVVLLNLWATWCVPCREEMPTLDRLQTKLGGKDFEVVALSIDQEGLPLVKDFYRELGLSALDVYVDDGMRSPSRLGVVGIPATLLLDRQGREIGRKLGPAEWDSPEVVEKIRGYIDSGAD